MGTTTSPLLVTQSTTSSSNGSQPPNQPSTRSRCLTTASTTSLSIPTNIDCISNPSSFGPKGQRLTFNKQRKVRIAIEVIFERNYYTNYSPNELPSYVKAICDQLKYPNHCSVKK